MQETTQNLFEKFVWVNPDITIYGGQISMNKTPLKVADIPKDLITEGGLKLCDGAKFNPISKYRGKVRSLLLECGQSFLGGYAVPASEWPDIKIKLNEIQNGFYSAAFYFTDHWKEYVQEWAESKPEPYRSVIIDVAPSPEAIRHRFSFDTSVAHLNPIADGTDALVKQVTGLKGDVLKDISQRAAQAIRGYESGSSQITVKMRGPIEVMIKKLRSLSFVSPQLSDAADAISDYFSSIAFPSEGKLPPEVQSKVAILLLALKTPENIPDIANVLKQETDKVEKAHSLSNDESDPTETPDTRSDDNATYLSGNTGFEL